jgi:hypothetical protein
MTNFEGRQAVSVTYRDAVSVEGLCFRVPSLLLKELLDLIVDLAPALLLAATLGLELAPTVLEGFDALGETTEGAEDIVSTQVCVYLLAPSHRRSQSCISGWLLLGFAHQARAARGKHTLPNSGFLLSTHTQPPLPRIKTRAEGSTRDGKATRRKQ